LYCASFFFKACSTWNFHFYCRRFDSRWCHWNFSLTYSFRPLYDPGVDSASNRNEYQKCLLVCKCGGCVGLTNLPPSCADFLYIWEYEPTVTLRSCQDHTGIVVALLLLSLKSGYVEFIKVIC
jgi:hypothetical protein